MAALTTTEKLKVLADAAKYDASCASSGSAKRNAARSGGIGSTEGMGICHAYAPDGRCISLLKVLLTNYCIFDCRYCVNRVSSNVQRARFSPKELADLTLDFYKRNYIEGLFLSSGIIRSPDYTMEQMNAVVRVLRDEHGFKGYVHLKTIPEADPALIEEAGRLADRLSTNIELPTDQGLKRFAPEKTAPSIKRAMAGVRLSIDETKAAKARKAKLPVFAPAGQTSQMIVGADGSDDAAIIRSASLLYAGYRLKRVYYSAFSPIPDASKDLPPSPPPLKREHRLYQADWMVRFYGFDAEEVISAAPAGMLDLDIDPKLSWALANRDRFPVDVNRAGEEMLLRVPGLGPKSVKAILSARRFGRLRLDDLKRITRSVRKLAPFVVTVDHRPGRALDAEDLRSAFLPPPKPVSPQLSLFA